MDLVAATVSENTMRDFFPQNVSPRCKVNLSSPRVDRLAPVFFSSNPQTKQLSNYRESCSFGQR